MTATVETDQAGSRWCSIETAPKDGRIVTVRQGQFGPFHMYWRDGWQPIEYFFGTPTHWLPPEFEQAARTPEAVESNGSAPTSTPVSDDDANGNAQ